MSVAIIGGSFDPVHNGHLALAKMAHETLNYDEVVFVPVARSPFKNEAHASMADRYAMLLAAVKDVPYAKVSPVEFARPDPSYTVDTVRYFRDRLPAGEKIGLVIGTDQALLFTKWKDWETILKMATVVVVRRGTGDLPIAYPFVFVSFEGDDSSSTEIRYDVSGNRDSLPEGVFNYIEKKGLYA